MPIRKLMIGTLAAAALAALAEPADARTNVDVFVNVGPPPVRYEVVPAPRIGFLWAPGHWAWRHHHHVWVPGHWVRNRPGFVYAPARWVDRDGRWHYEPAAWRRWDQRYYVYGW